MFIEELILDGFKSYSVRTVLGPFDQQFNAITGLNGSGKSNVLDGICFVLGITNLSKVRAGNLSELVYKQGQAGITKASVTIVFNNDDKARSPVGFESCDKITVCRQIVIGGRNRFFLNGKAAQTGDISNLFRSVQLNINNPHFLIMQGSITKVINMKPQEILGMIEEAAGTSMYESKKHEALRILERKQLKVEEIDRIIREEIEPQLSKLTQEKQAFTEWSEMVSKADDLERLVISWAYRDCAGKLEGGGGQFDQTESELKTWKESYKALKSSVAKSEERAKADTKSLEKQKAAMEEAERALDNEAQTARRQLSDSKAVLKEKSNSLNSTSGKQRKSKQTEAKLEKDIVESKSELAKAVKELEEGKLKFSTCESALDAQQKLVSDLNAGGAGDGSSGQSLQQELTAHKSTLEDVVSETKAVGVKLKGLDGQLKQLTAGAAGKKGTGEYDSLVQEHKQLQEKKFELDKKLASFGYDPKRVQELGDRIRSGERKIESLTETRNSLNSSLSQRLSVDIGGLPGFGPDRVKGMVAKLISIKPEFGDKYLRALEVLAGGKLFNVVVDSERTSRELLESGALKRRLTFLPLDRIQGKRVSELQLREALAVSSRVGGEVVPAIETVAFRDEFTAALEYVFSTAFVTDKDEAGKQATFNTNLPENQRHKTVTADGDVYDPRGSLTGGSDGGDGRGGTGRLLSSIYELQKVVYDLSDVQRETEKLQGEKQQMLTYKDSYEKCAKELSLVVHALSLAESKLRSTSQAQVVEQVEDVRKAVEAAKVRLAELGVEEGAVKTALAKTEAEIRDMSVNRAEKVKAATAKVATLKKEKKAVGDLVREIEARVAELDVTVKSAEEELRSFKEDQSQQSEQASVLAGEIAVLEQKVTELSDSVEALVAKMKEARIAKDSFDKAIGDVVESLGTEKRKLEEAEAAVKRLEADMERLERARADAKKEIDGMEKQYNWLKQQRGQILANADLGKLSAAEIEGISNKLSDLKTDINIKGKSVNKRIVGLIDKSQQEAGDLLAKRERLDKDKGTLQEFLRDLDDKKGRALTKTWQIVNSNFGAIFRSLLPNVDAKLAPPQGWSALEGLELRVQLGSVWKDSLTELSGGQKSLLALSLVLALLLFKPAPFYILDEVDAALDVSHTRNIGKMIRQHFPHSQFVVVSLKDGMFNNANVLFRVTFENGTSVVSRNEQQPQVDDQGDLISIAHQGEIAAAAAGKKKVVLKPKGGKKNGRDVEDQEN